MADISDVTAYLKQAALAAVYPNGTSQPSVAGCDVKLFEGWPLPADLDAALAASKAQVSVYPMPGTGVVIPQILDETYTIVAPSYGMTFSVDASGTVITVSGQPTSGEYLTIIADRANTYSQTGASTAAILAALATAAQAQYPTASVTPTTLTIPAHFAMTVRQGGPGVQAKVTHRQRHSVMVTAWAPTPTIRTQLAAAIDVAIKSINKIALPDTSQALIVYSRTNISDEGQSANVYRRDLIYDVEYATLLQFPAYVITSTDTTIANPSNTAIAQAIA